MSDISMHHLHSIHTIANIFQGYEAGICKFYQCDRLSLNDERHTGTNSRAVSCLLGLMLL